MVQARSPARNGVCSHMVNVFTVWLERREGRVVYISVKSDVKGASSET